MKKYASKTITILSLVSTVIFTGSILQTYAGKAQKSASIALPSQVEAFANQYTAQVRGGHTHSIMAISDFPNGNAGLSSALDRMRMVLTGSSDLRPINYQWSAVKSAQGGSTAHYRVLFEFQNNNTYYFLDCAIRETGNSHVMTKYYITASSVPFESYLSLKEAIDSINPFLLIAILLSLGLIMGTLILLIVSDIPKEWAFAILTLVCFPRIQLSSMSGYTAFKLGITFFPLALSKPDILDPWVISWIIPAGAIIVLFVLLRHRKRKLSPDQNPG